MLAFRWIGRPLALARIALASFIAFAFSHNVGLAFLGGSAVRYRMYSSWGIAPADLARAIAFNFTTLWLGFLAGAASLLNPLRHRSSAPSPQSAESPFS